MSDDNSNDVIMVENIDDSSKSCDAPAETRPIMLLFQRLISSDNKENTILTNAQIISILKEEFDIHISTLHELEVDIYLNVVKRFLKDWPLWDEFDRSINWLRKQKALTLIQKTLEQKYLNLKEYLKVQIDITRPLAREAVDKMIKETTEKMDQVNTSDIILEICCSRRQLNELIYSEVNPELDNNIFNVPVYEMNKISINSLPIEALFNWWDVQVSIEMKSLNYTRTTMHQLKHVLVNKKNGPRVLNQPLKTNVFIKDRIRVSESVEKVKLYNIFNSLLEKSKSDKNMYKLLDCLFCVIYDDLKMLAGNFISVPFGFKQYMNEYRYYRKLRKEMKTKSVNSAYDLYLEETLAPMHVSHISILGAVKSNLIPANYTWLTIVCVQCNVKFTGPDIFTNLQDHYNTRHTHESNWNCTNCHRKFTMIHLSENRWYHNCTKD